MEMSSSIIDEAFFELLVSAQIENFTERETTIFNMRYGIGAFDRRHTLQEIGNHIGVTRERIRQILVKCDRKLKGRARIQEKRAQTDKAAFQLLQYVRHVVAPKEPDIVDRLVRLIQTEGSALHQKEHVIELLVHLVCSVDEEKEIIQSVYDHIRIQKIPIAKSIQKMFLCILWPKDLTVVTDEYTSLLSRTREVTKESYEGWKTDRITHIGDYYSKKMGRNIQYESGVEHVFLKRLESHPEVVFYQEQPFSIEYEGADGKTYHYHPDIFVVLQDRRGFIVEIKPRLDMLLYKNVIKGRALWRFCRANGFGMLITDGHHDIIALRDRPVPVAAAEALLTRLDQGCLKWNEYCDIRDRFHITTLDFLSIVLKHRLIWYRQPFRIEKDVKVI